MSDLGHCVVCESPADAFDALPTVRVIDITVVGVSCVPDEMSGSGEGVYCASGPGDNVPPCVSMGGTFIAYHGHSISGAEVINTSSDMSDGAEGEGGSWMSKSGY